MPTSLNPFAALTREIAEQVLDDHRLKREAEQKLSRILATYKKLADDPQYRALYDELVSLMGDQLRRLVRHATACRRCGALANRITVLQEVVSAPLETVWFEREQAQASPETPEAAVNPMDGTFDGD